MSLGLIGGCTKVCNDDGFAWQQDPSCLLGATEGSSSSADPTSDSETETASTQPTTIGGGQEWCSDKDMDGYGDPEECTSVPPGGEPPPGTVDNDDDCDDSSDKTFPGAAPNDDPNACMKDEDDDDWGDDDPPNGGGGGGGIDIIPGSDCDDSSDTTFPGAAPNDDPDACMKDDDGDDWGDDDPPSGGGGGGGGIVPGTDCDDNQGLSWSTCGSCVDGDNDGWYDECDIYPRGFGFADCDDSDPNTFPGSAPNDDPDACMTDKDDDDWGDDDPESPDAVPGTDCDDESDTTHPGAAPEDDPDACMTDDDGDDHGDSKPNKPGVTPGSDCFDDNPSLNPAAQTLVTAPNSQGAIKGVDTATGTVSGYATIDIADFTPWLPTSLAVNPTDGSVYAALAFQDSLVTMNYCGDGPPTPLAADHNKTICGITFDSSGQLYGIDGQVDELLIFNPDGSLVGTKKLTYNGQLLNVGECGMAYDCHEDRLLISDSISGGVFSVDPSDGVAELVADLNGEDMGGGLEYNPKNRRAISCLNTTLFSVALDGSNDATKLPSLSEKVDDLLYGPKCD